MEAAENQKHLGQAQTDQQMYKRPWLFLLAGAGIMLVALWLWSTISPNTFMAQFDDLVGVDIEQGRIDTAPPPPHDELLLTQTFIPRHNGLSQVEITLLRHDGPTPQEEAVLLVQLFDAQNRPVAEKTLPTSTVTHNQVLNLDFPPQNHSKGQAYQLVLSGTSGNPVSAWAYSLDVYDDGSLAGDPSASPAQDLRFLTRYRLTWPDAFLVVARTLYYEGLLLLLSLVIMPLPGVLLLLADHAYRRRHVASSGDSRCRSWDPAAWWGAALGLGAAAWPVLWLWLTMFGGRWTSWLLTIVLTMGWLFAIAYWWRERRRRKNVESAAVTRGKRPPITDPWRRDHLFLLAILLLALVVRLVAVRDTPVLPWVDAARHGLITAVMAESGQVISNYTPYLPVERFPYHFGFHTLSSTMLLVTNWPLERLMLVLGQLINTLITLMVYAAVWLLISSRRAGYLAALLVALPFFFPAYYTTWGRLTQLTAVLLLPLLIAFTWQLIRGDHAWLDRWWLTGIMAAGLFLIHFRVFVYFLPFPILALLASRFRRTRWLAAAAILTFILVLPRVFTLLQDINPARSLGQTIPDYNNFPMNYLRTGWEQAFLIVAAGALLIVLAAALHRQSWTVLPLVLLAWVVTLFALLSLDRLGLPIPSLVNLNSMYITLFVPLAIYLAVVFEPICQWLENRNGLVQAVGYGLVGLIITALLIFGVRRQVSILNQQTLLARFEDTPALRWLNDNLAGDALIAVNSWRWLGQTWAAADGGGWILPLTAQSTTTPPIDYIYNRDLFLQIVEFNETAVAVSDWSDPAQADWLRKQGVTHVFIGKRGGFLDPAQLLRNPKIEKLYGHDGVFIFVVLE